MRIGTRLFAFAVALPAAAVGVGLLAQTFVVEGLLLDAVDRALRAQAAVEAVSLFDERPEPHLHAPQDPEIVHLARFASSRAVLDPAGRVVVHSLDHPTTHFSLIGLDFSKGPVLRTTLHPEGEMREIFVAVRSPTGEPYVLWIGEPLADTRAVLRQLASRGAIVAFLFALAAAAISTWQSRRLTQRIRALTDFMLRIERGKLDQDPPPDTTDDELGFLRGRVAAATREVRRIREAEARWIADAAHELRTPLAGLAATIDVTLRRERSAAELVQSLMQARAEVDRLTRLSEDLLKLHAVQREAARAQTVELRPFLDEVVAAVRPRADERNIRVDLSADPGTTAEISRQALRRAIDNLLDNALKHSPSGGAVGLSLLAFSDHFELRVSDDGPGIPREEAEFVFEPFHRVDHAAPGFGLGLALVREVAEEMGGRAWVATARGEGRSTVALRWPRQRSQ